MSTKPRFRPGEEKWEELVNNALSSARGNSLHAKGLVKSAGRGLHVLADASPPQEPTGKLPHPATDERTAAETQYLPPLLEIGADYRITVLTVAEGADSDAMYQADYKQVLEQMVDLVLETEAPIYEDILVERIARAHKKERAGRIIQDTLIGAIAGRHPSVPEDGRKVVFHHSMAVNRLVAYRPARSDWRSHRDIPIVELASLALPMVRKSRSDSDILAHYARTFSLSRLREPTRKRFEAAIAAARLTSFEQA